MSASARPPRSPARRAALRSLALWSVAHGAMAQSGAPAAFPDLVERLRPSIVAIGTLQPLRAPHFEFRGTGFAIGDGLTIATNAHVLPDALDAQQREAIGVAVPAADGTARLRPARVLRADRGTDLALLRIDGERLPALGTAGPADPPARAGTGVALVGFPLGSALGLYAAVHRGTIAAITPLALPPRQARQLDPHAVQRLRAGPLLMYQLDAIALPGNSGSPLVDASSGAVLGVVNQALVRTAKEGVLSAPSGITYAVPVNYLLDLARDIR